MYLLELGFSLVICPEVGLLDHIVTLLLLLLLLSRFVSDSVQPHRWQPTRLLRPWDSPGKNTGVGCHCLKSSKLQLSPLTLISIFSSGPGIYFSWFWLVFFVLKKLLDLIQFFHVFEIGSLFFFVIFAYHIDYKLYRCSLIKGFLSLLNHLIIIPISLEL